LKISPAPGEPFTQNETSHAVVTHPADDPSRHLGDGQTCGEPQKPPDFSLVLGGPLFQFFRRTRLSGAALELWRRRVLVIALFAWLPLFFLSAIEGHALGGSMKIPFLRDIEAHVRFLIALPVLIVAELIVHNRVSPSIRRFVERRIVVTQDLPAFGTAVKSALWLRDSVAVELTLLFLVYTVGVWIWLSQVALDAPTWYATPDARHLNLTLAGYWYAFVSIPLFQFVLMRWYLRLVIWFRLLWKISRLNLHLSAAHPDRAGGIGFLGKSSYAFGPILFAQGALMSGLIASRVLYEGQGLMSFKMEAAGFVAFFVAIILGPLVMFAPLLDRAKRKGSAGYGLLANRYVFAFEHKWMQPGEPAADHFLGSADIQSMSSLENTYANVSRMRLVPFGTQDITRLAAATAAPLLPLALTIFSLPELLKFLVKLLFH
jgi:hypothetical protein